MRLTTEGVASKIKNPNNRTKTKNKGVKKIQLLTKISIFAHHTKQLYKSVDKDKRRYLQNYY